VLIVLLLRGILDNQALNLFDKSVFALLQLIHPMLMARSSSTKPGV
jgi:hypothetical protein